MVKAKRKSAGFFCSACGTTAGGWLGRCPGCGQFNTMVEAPTASAPRRGRSERKPAAPPVPFSKLQAESTARWDTGIEELNRVLGGGLVPGSLVLLGGVPGIGKSTLLLQAGAGLARHGRNVLYATGEESVNQIALRAQRLGIADEGMSLVAENDLSVVLPLAESCEVLILDSIQTAFHPDLPALPGTISQIRECAAHLSDWAKSRGISVFIVGHVTKEGIISGPRLLEHMVDAVLYFEGDQNLFYRMVRAIKNRFGATNELGIFRMAGDGLAEVLNPAEIFLSARSEQIEGTAIACVLSGSRPLLCELQALATPPVYSTARRVAAGVDYNRLMMILAILERRAGIPVANRDIYVSVVGGLRLQDDPGADLAVALALTSHLLERPLPAGLVAFGELTLSGEVRTVLGAELRLKESTKLGRTAALVPAGRELEKNSTGLAVTRVASIAEALRAAGLTKGGVR